LPRRPLLGRGVRQKAEAVKAEATRRKSPDLIERGRREAAFLCGLPGSMPIRRRPKITLDAYLHCGVEWPTLSRPLPSKRSGSWSPQLAASFISDQTTQCRLLAHGVSYRGAAPCPERDHKRTWSAISRSLPPACLQNGQQRLTNWMAYVVGLGGPCGGRIAPTDKGWGCSKL
jgi:hypothetical protein